MEDDPPRVFGIQAVRVVSLLSEEPKVTLYVRHGTHRCHQAGALSAAAAGVPVAECLAEWPIAGGDLKPSDYENYDGCVRRVQWGSGGWGSFTRPSRHARAIPRHASVARAEGSTYATAACGRPVPNPNPNPTQGPQRRPRVLHACTGLRRRQRVPARCTGSCVGCPLGTRRDCE